MAIIARITCRDCGREAEVMYSASRPKPKTCSACKKDKEAAKRKAHFEALDKLSLEERLRRVEAWIYDYRPSKSINEVIF